MNQDDGVTTILAAAVVDAAVQQDFDQFGAAVTSCAVWDTDKSIEALGEVIARAPIQESLPTDAARSDTSYDWSIDDDIADAIVVMFKNDLNADRLHEIAAGRITSREQLLANVALVAAQTVTNALKMAGETITSESVQRYVVEALTDGNTPSRP